MQKHLFLLGVIFISVSTNLFAAQISDYSMTTYDQNIRHMYQDPKLKTHHIPKRIEIISGFFLGKPYVHDPLGEGKNAPFDQDPLYRTDAFDCLTYVSTVLALAESYNLNQFKKNILKTQYFQAIPTFVNRLHFTDADWNIVNQKNGFIKDITPSFKNEKGATIAKMVQTFINKPAWFQKLPASRLNFIQPLTPREEQVRLNELHQLSQQVKAEKITVAYLPLTTLFNAKGEPNLFVFNQIPSGSIIEIVRPNWNLENLIGTRLNISHLGFAIRSSQGLVFREASSLENRVIDVALIDYLKNYFKSETVKGINVQQVI